MLHGPPDVRTKLRGLNERGRQTELVCSVPRRSRRSNPDARGTESLQRKTSHPRHDRSQAMEKGGHGFVEDRKPDDTVRLLLESYNCLQYFTDKKKRTKIHTIDHTRKRLQGDLLAGVEPGTDWDIAKKQGGDNYHNLFGMGEDRKSVCAHNSTKQSAKSQYGGTCMMAFGVFSSHIEKPSLDPERGVDRRGLGSYCSLVTMGKTARPARVVTYYRPNNESRHKEPKKGRQTVFT